MIRSYAIVFILMLSTVVSAESRRSVLVSIGSESELSMQWKKDICHLIHDSWNHEGFQNDSVECISLIQNEMTNAQQREALQSGKYDLHIELRDFKNEINLRATNLNPMDELDFKQVGWRVEKKDMALANVASLIMDFRSNFERRLPFRGELAYHASTVSKNVKLEGRRFIDAHTQEPISVSQALQIMSEENSVTADYLRAAIELSVGLAVGGVGYVLDHSNKVDWEFGVQESFKSKILGTSGHKFDDNNGPKTNWGHANAGAFYYLTCRANGMNQLQAFICNMVASSAWEFIIEYREVVSINDQVFTIVGGSVIGEALHLIGRAFAKKGDSLFYKTLSAVFDSPTAFNLWLEKKYPHLKRTQRPFANLVSQIELAIGRSQRDQYSDYTTIQFDGQVWNTPGFESAGQGQQIIMDTVYAKYFYEKKVGATSPNLQAFRVVAQTAFAAYQSKNIQSKNGQLIGYSVLVAPSSRIEADSYGLGSQQWADEFMAVVNVLGPMVQVTGYYKGIKILATFSMFADFSMMRSLALEKFSASEDISQITGVLKNKGYYYALGHTATGDLMLTYDRYSFGVSGRTTSAYSIQSRYRDSDVGAIVPEMQDRRDRTEIYSIFELSKNIHVKVVQTDIRRSGEINNFYAQKKRERIRSIYLSYQF